MENNTTIVASRIPNSVRDRLAEVARANSRSVAGELRHLIAREYPAAPPAPRS